MGAASYFERFGCCDRQIQARPHPDLRLAVVIPCYNEPDLIGTLQALWDCHRPAGGVEIIAVVNSSPESSEAIRQQNAETLRDALEWIGAHQDSKLAFHLLHHPDLPPRHAGVGLARKIGMDEASRRFDDLERLDQGVIACFDADCRCDPNYLVSIAAQFERYPRTPGCSIYFEHPLAGSLPLAVYQAAAHYELHLRFYVQALRLAEFPYAHHTVGSAMAVRSSVYQEQGGMNKRKAGEDFYFLQKILPLPGFIDLTTTRVIPSPRPSDRVPFGTGRAVRELLEGAPARTYPMEAFLDLRWLFSKIEILYNCHSFSEVEAQLRFPEPLHRYLLDQQFWSELAEIQSNTASPAAFRKRFFGWFNGFRVMKYVHFARDHYYGSRSLLEEAAALLKLRLEPTLTKVPPLFELLDQFRELDRRPQAAAVRSDGELLKAQ